MFSLWLSPFNILLLGGVFFALGAALSLYGALRGMSVLSRLKDLPTAFYVAMLSGYLLAALCILAAIGVLLARLVTDANSTLADPFLVPLLVLGAVLLYRLRGRNPVAYGIVECGVAILGISFTVATQSQGALAKLLGLTGGVYIIVRGLDNIDKGLTPDQRSKLMIFERPQEITFVSPQPPSEIP